MYQIRHSQKLSRRIQQVVQERKAIAHDKELAEKRFKGAIIRGLAYGKKTVDIPRDFEDGRDRERYVGEATVWATLEEDGTIIYRAWPPAWEGPYHITTLDGTTINGRSHEHFTIYSLRQELEYRNQCARAFELSQEHDSLFNSWRSSPAQISKAEAVVIVRFKNCWHAGLSFLKACKLLPLKPNEIVRWPFAEQDMGKAVLARLQKAYGVHVFPSPEATCVAAQCLRIGWDEIPEWLQSESACIDIALAIIIGNIWHFGGPMKTRNTLKNMPIRNYDPGRWDRDEFQRFAIHIDQSIVTSRSDLDTLINLSPIARAAVDGYRYGKGPRRYGPSSCNSSGHGPTSEKFDHEDETEDEDDYEYEDEDDKEDVDDQGYPL